MGLYYEHGLFSETHSDALMDVWRFVVVLTIFFLASMLMLNKILLIRSTILVVSFRNNVLMNNIYTNNSFRDLFIVKRCNCTFSQHISEQTNTQQENVKDLFQIQLIYEEHIRYMIILSKYLQISIKETCI